jgi:hypothetical protein
MRILIFSLSFFFSLSVYSQDAEIIKNSSKLFKEIYSIDRSTKLKHGEYLKLNRKTKDTLVFGKFQNDIKSGVWKYYSSNNTLWMTYDFERKAILLIPAEISRIDSFIVKRSDSFSNTKVDLPPVYLGSKKEIESILSANFTIPKEIIENVKSEISIFSFVVDQNGKIKDFKNEQAVSKEVIKEVEANIKLVDGEWSPAFVDNVPIDARLLLVYEILPEGAKPIFNDHAKAIVIHCKYPVVQNTRKPIGIAVGTVD